MAYNKWLVCPRDSVNFDCIAWIFDSSLLTECERCLCHRSAVNVLESLGNKTQIMYC